MNILVFNVGSTTLKFACFDMPSGTRLTHGTVDRIGQPSGDAANHLSAANVTLQRHSDLEIAALGHRIVQGGDRFSNPTLVNAEVLQELTKLDELAPLHNPPARAVVPRRRLPPVRHRHARHAHEHHRRPAWRARWRRGHPRVARKRWPESTSREPTFPSSRGTRSRRRWFSKTLCERQ